MATPSSNHNNKRSRDDDPPHKKQKVESKKQKVDTTLLNGLSMAIYGSLIQWSAACPTIDEIETMVMDCVPLKYMDNMYNLTVSHLVICIRTPEEIGKMRVHLDSLTKDIDDCIDRVKNANTALMLINEDQYTVVARHQKELICIDVHKKAINMENALGKCNSVMAVEIEDCGTSPWNDPPSILPASDTCVWRGKERMCRYV
eukprot:948281_1